MAHLYLVRHSVPEIDPSVPASQWHLSAEGILRASSLAQNLAASVPNIEIIVSSAEPKARETAEILSEVTGLPFSVVAGLHEHERTRQAFLVRGRFEEKIVEFFANPE